MLNSVESITANNTNCNKKRFRSVVKILDRDFEAACKFPKELFRANAASKEAFHFPTFSDISLNARRKDHRGCAMLQSRQNYFPLCSEQKAKKKEKI